MHELGIVNVDLHGRGNHGLRGMRYLWVTLSMPSRAQPGCGNVFLGNALFQSRRVIKHSGIIDNCDAKNDISTKKL
jgi:hypothetical protein